MPRRGRRTSATRGGTRDGGAEDAVDGAGMLALDARADVADIGERRDVASVTGARSRRRKPRPTATSRLADATSGTLQLLASAASTAAVTVPSFARFRARGGRERTAARVAGSLLDAPRGGFETARDERETRPRELRTGPLRDLAAVLDRAGRAGVAETAVPRRRSAARSRCRRDRRRRHRRRRCSSRSLRLGPPAPARTPESGSATAAARRGSRNRWRSIGNTQVDGKRLFARLPRVPQPPFIGGAMALQHGVRDLPAGSRFDSAPQSVRSPRSMAVRQPPVGNARGGGVDRGVRTPGTRDLGRRARLAGSSAPRRIASRSAMRPARAPQPNRASVGPRGAEHARRLRRTRRRASTVRGSRGSPSQQAAAGRRRGGAESKRDTAAR